MSEPEEDFAAMFEASLKAKRFERGQTIEGTIVAIGPAVAFVDVGGKGEADDRGRRTEGRRRQSRGRCRRPHPGDGRVDRRRADAFPDAGARGRNRAATRRRVPGRPAGRRQGRTRREGRVRGAHRAPARLLPDLSNRHPAGTRIPRSTRGASTGSESSSTRKAARTSSSRGERCSRTSSGRSAVEIRRSIVAGAVLTGRVTSVREFGAFIDLGAGVQGLLHVSEMGWSRVSDTSQVVTPGDEITVKVLRVDEATQKISLGLKQLTDDPWSRVADHVRGGPGAHRPRHAPRGVRRVRRARAGGRRVGARLDVRADGPVERMDPVGCRRNERSVRDPEHRSREEAHRRRARSGGLGAGRGRGVESARHRARRAADAEKSSVTRSSACSCSSLLAARV